MIALVVLTFAPTLVVCSGEGNIHLLENEIAFVLKNCISDNSNGNNDYSKRYRRSNNITDDVTNPNKYDCTKNITENISINPNCLDLNNNDSYGKNFTDVKKSMTSFNYTDVKTNRTRRSAPLFTKPDTDQCLSQCVFANLQVVDSRGIPRETELWNLVQSSVTSQQSRAALQDQIRACFQELQSETEDNGCSYSNKLERCLMLRFSDRQIETTKKKQETLNRKNTSKFDIYHLGR